MKGCPQTDTQSILEHGFSVKNRMFDLIYHIRDNKPLKYNWILPKWIYNSILIENLPNDQIIKIYCIFHDIGKYRCITYDEQGKKHFPNHAEISYKTFKKYFDNPVSAELIRKDMDFHLLRTDKLKEFSEYKYCTTLILSALSEIHSNAEMFGGINSTSFKIKWKHTDRRGRQIINLLKNKSITNK